MMASGVCLDARCSPSSTLSSTLCPMKTLVFWKVRTTPRSAISLGLRPSILAPR